MNRNAFSLVELLVVLGILLISVAIALPAIQSARESARRAQCASNLRQFHFNYHSREDHKRTYIEPINRCPSALEPLGYSPNPLITNPATFTSTTTTIEYFEYAGGTIGPDFLGPEEWFNQTNVQKSTTMKYIREFIAIDRHSGDTANYLFLDGHVAAIPAVVIEEWADDSVNFLLPGSASLP